MFDAFAVVRRLALVIALFSAGIFLAHAIEAYSDKASASVEVDRVPPIPWDFPVGPH